MIETFVLLIMLNDYQAAAVATVSGYDSMQACTEAAAQVLKASERTYKKVNAFCVPGPRQYKYH